MMMNQLLRWVVCVSLISSIPAGAADVPMFNGKTAPEWATMLKDDGTPRKRRAAALALGQMMLDSKELHKDFFPIMIRALKNDSQVVVRLELARVLGQQSLDSAQLFVPDLADALRGESDSEVRRELAEGIGRAGALAGNSVLPLIATLKDPALPTRTAAVLALGKIGPDARGAADAVVALAATESRPLRAAVVFTLGRIDPEKPDDASAAIVKLLSAEHALGAKRESEFVTSAITSLGLLKTARPEVIRVLAGFLTDADLDIRLRTALALAMYGTAAKPAEAELRKMLESDADKLARRYAVRALSASYGPDGAKLLPIWTARLKADPAFEVRVAIAEELGALGAAGADAITALQDARKDPQLKVREAATMAIRQITKPIEIPKEEKP